MINLAQDLSLYTECTPEIFQEVNQAAGVESTYHIH